MLKLVARRLLRALPLCALPLVASKAALAQRPSNALPPPTAKPAPEAPSEAPHIEPSEPAPRVDEGPAEPSAGVSPEVRGLGEFLEGRDESFSLKLSEVGSGWRSLRVVRDPKAGRGEASAPTGAGASDPFYRDLLKYFAAEPNTFLTRGRTLRLNGDDHLVLYRVEFPAWSEGEKWFEQRLRGGTPGVSEMLRLTREFLGTVPLRASLLNTRHIVAMEAIESFDFESRFDRFSEYARAEMAKSQPRRPSQPAAPQAARPAAPVAPVAPTAPVEPRVVPVPDAVAQVAASEPLRRLFAAVQRYRADNGDVLPPLEELAAAQAALAPYLEGSESWRDPVSGRLFAPNARLSGRRMAHLRPFASSLILFYSEPDSSGKRTVLRLDGIVRRVTPDEWARLSGTSSVQ